MNHIAHAHDKHETAQLGFWLYLMTDLMLFAGLFATYMVLRGGTAGGPTAAELFDPTFALSETIVLLLSSFTCGIAALALRYKKQSLALWGLGLTIALGLVFLALEMKEFAEFYSEGHTWQASAFLSSFFTLVGTHGLHISIGLVWASTLLGYLIRSPHHDDAHRKMSLFALFWHFLDIIWVFIFTIVYLLGVLS
ncbi:MAG TPA: cytochrome c oxidase subunit 3 [Candidatus Saccharibacteria bacterium]|nr:cytochrome c oxidase subunit 3 [Candidatus Saccharibacteria bacterium]